MLCIAVANHHTGKIGFLKPGRLWDLGVKVKDIDVFKVIEILTEILLC
jgi:hypothetical protein